MTEVVLELVALVLERVEGLVLNLADRAFVSRAWGPRFAIMDASLQKLKIRLHREDRATEYTEK